MDPKIIIIIAVSYLYFFFEVFLNLRQRRKSKVESSNDKGSLRLLYGLITVGYFLSFAFGVTKLGRIYHWNTFFAIGMSLIGIGLVLRIHLHPNSSAVFHIFRRTSAEPRNNPNRLVQIHQASRVSRTNDHFPGNLYFNVQLDFNFSHDAPYYACIPLPH